ncbi:MAG: (p)ppGpp synthetase SpoT/RelA [Bacteroidota bacterium]|jgi:GTP pyrophosphokinase
MSQELAATMLSQDQEKRAIQKAYREMLKSIKSEMTMEDKEAIYAAYQLAKKSHEPQRRKSGEAYIFHPIAVARICAEEIGLGPTAIISALLHDVVEDTPVTLQDIERQFGPKIAKIVDSLTKLDNAYDSESPQAANFQKVLMSLFDDVRVVFIKMADRLHNMRTLGAMPRDKQLKIAAETTYVYAPLAHRLGLYQFKTEFQDLAMKITNREEYSAIAQQLNSKKKERDLYIAEFIRPLRIALDELELEYEIFGRPKSIFSIWNKVKSQNVEIEQIEKKIYDLFAIRIIIKNLPEKEEKFRCFQVYSIVTDVHTPIADRMKDMITTPKANGYESLHTTVIGPNNRFVEVQIRSKRMNDIAERGFAAHWKYKDKSGNVDKKGAKKQDLYEMWIEQVRESVESQKSNAVQFLEDVKTTLFSDEVIVYTPKGEAVRLPKGATALDFAFQIHTDVGYRCMATKVNDRIVPLSYVLQNGDHMEVITNKNQKPNEDWLSFVLTGKARSRIRGALKEEMKQQSQMGKETLMRKLDHLKADFEENVDLLVKWYNYTTRLDFYYALTLDRVNLSELKKFKVIGRKLYEPEPEPEPVEDHTAANPSGPSSPPHKSKKSGTQAVQARLLIGGEPAERYAHSFASCCNPVQGDEIFGYVTVGNALKIHRTNCPNATNLMASYAYRVRTASWVDAPHTTNFTTTLSIKGVDVGVGVIERLSHNISNLGLNIRSFYIDGKDGYFEGRIRIVVTNTDQLELAIRSLKKQEGVTMVLRED